MNFLDVSKEILSLTRCPTVRALVFRNTEQTAVEQLRQGEVLRLNRNHLLTRNSFTGSTGLAGNSGGPAGPRRTLRRKRRFWTPPGLRPAVRRLGMAATCRKVLHVHAHRRRLSAPPRFLPRAMPFSVPNSTAGVDSEARPRPILATGWVCRNSPNRSRYRSANARRRSNTHQRRCRGGP